MSYRFHKAAPPLDQFVERLWSCSDVTVHARERILPSGTVELVVNLRDNEIRGCHPSDPSGRPSSWLAWSRDSRRVAIARDNGKIAVWDLHIVDQILARPGLNP